MNTGEKSFTNAGNHFHRYLQYASSIITSYNGNEPFHLYLKKYFSGNKKHGSRDRKLISSLCYAYFRLSLGLSSSIPMDERLLLATFLIEKNPSLLLEQLKPGWNENIHLDISEKVEMVKENFNLKKVFPFRDELSDEINFQEFNLSFSIQPKLFIRIRPGYKNAVFNKLRSANISFEKMSDSCLAFTNNEKVSDIITIDKEAVIQDYNSQSVGNFLTPDIVLLPSSISLWDCCAASGGKSILAYDTLKKTELTVSDTRKKILENLRIRFAKAGIKNYHSFIADLSAPLPNKVKGSPFDLIIADVPCSGSGTWARTPEQLHFFQEKNINRYSLLQREIVSNSIPYLAENGYLLYITCSVFKKENEENVDFIEKNLHLKLIKSNYLKGYQMQADTLFVALFRK